MKDSVEKWQKELKDQGITKINKQTPHFEELKKYSILRKEKDELVKEKKEL